MTLAEKSKPHRDSIAAAIKAAQADGCTVVFNLDEDLCKRIATKPDCLDLGDMIERIEVYKNVRLP